MRRSLPLAFALIATLAATWAQTSDAIQPSRAVDSTHNCANYYPPEAERRNETGDVLVRYDVDASGGINDVTVVRSSGYADLDTAAVLCVQTHWQNTPATRNGVPVASLNHHAIIRFLLDSAPERTVARRAPIPARRLPGDLTPASDQLGLGVLALIALSLLATAGIASRFITRGPETR